MHDVVEVDVLVRVHKEDGAATDHIGHRVAYQVTTDNQDTRRLRSPDELVRREEHGVDRMCRIPFRSHVNVDVRGCGGIVPEGQGSVGMQFRCDPRHVGQNPRHIAGSAERADE